MIESFWSKTDCSRDSCAMFMGIKAYKEGYGIIGMDNAQILGVPHFTRNIFVKDFFFVHFLSCLDDKSGNFGFSWVGINDDTDFQTSKCWKILGNDWNDKIKMKQIKSHIKDKADCVASPGDGKVVKNMICQKDLGNLFFLMVAHNLMNLVHGFGEFLFSRDLNLKQRITTNFRNLTTEARIETEVEAIKGPGEFLAFGEVKRRANKYVQLEFNEEVVLVGMVITTYKNYGLRKFRVRANNDLNSPSLLTMDEPISQKVCLLISFACFLSICFQPFYMCYNETLSNCDTMMEERGGFLKQTFYFTVPFPTTKVRLDEFEGAPEIAFSIDLFGLDNNKRRNIFNPMEGGYATTSMSLVVKEESLNHIDSFFQEPKIYTYLQTILLVLQEQQTMNL